MHPALLAAFFSTAVGGATSSFIRIPASNPNYTRWLLLYVLFILYRTKIMIDDLGWYADMKSKKVDPTAADVLFAITTWIGWFMIRGVGRRPSVVHRYIGGDVCCVDRVDLRGERRDAVR
jgi:hypothetical protein